LVELGLDQIAEKMNGTILQGSPSMTFSKFNIDSRLTEPGELFFALKANRNGHDYIPHALEKGAAGAVISQQVSLPQKNIALIQVEDTLQALQRLAREVLGDHKIKVVGITGSTGKTTTKEFAASLLSSHLHVLKSEGNFNNELGLPLSLLNLNNSHDVAVLEMAMSAPGEIRALTRIAAPDVAVITNISPVHLQFFKSIEEIELAKKEILEGTKKDGTAVLNGDDLRIEKISQDWKGRKILFGLSSHCEIRVQEIQKLGFEGMHFELVYGENKRTIRFPFFYESYLYNFLAAAAVGYSLSVPEDDIVDSIKNLELFPRRGILISLQKNIKLFDDSYNSNPKGLESALKGLADLPSKRRVAVLGDMLELGEDEVEFHIQAGKQVARFDKMKSEGS